MITNQRLLPLVVLVAALGAATAAAQVMLVLTPPVQDGTLIRVDNLFVEPPADWPLDQIPEIDPDAAREPGFRVPTPEDGPYLRAVFGDASQLVECSVAVPQGAVFRQGHDGYFQARRKDLGDLNEVTVLFTWDGIDSSGPVVTGFLLDAGTAAPTDGPGQPGQPFISE